VISSRACLLCNFFFKPIVLQPYSITFGIIYSI
jgi:hypothetical protein